MIPNIKFSPALILVLAVLAVPNASAKITVQVDAKDSFALGEKTYFDYSILSDSDANVAYLPYINCPTAPNALMDEKKITLKAGEKYSAKYSGIEVADFFEPQECTAYVQVTSPESVREEKKFRIDIDPSFDFSIFACTNETCTNKSRFFALGEMIYFGFESAVQEPEVGMELVTLGKNTAKKITLPYSVGADELGLGNYELRATAKKEGYKTMQKLFQFAVIEKHAEIPSASRCNGNNVCDAGENAQNCPQDCLSAGTEMPQPAQGGQAAEQGTDWLLVFGGAIVLLALAFLAYFFIYKPSRKNNP